MKKVFILLMMVSILVSCGSDNSSGGGGNLSNNSGISNSPINNPTNGNLQYFELSNIEDQFNNTAFGAGLSNGTTVRYYNPDLNNGSWFDFDFSFCWNCNQYEQLLKRSLDKLIFKRVNSSDSSSVDFDLATDIENNQFIFGANMIINRSSLNEIFQNGYGEAVVSNASIKLANGQTLGAYHVEKYSNWGERTSYIISTQIAPALNPVAEFSNGQLVKGLATISDSIKVQSVSFAQHSINQTWQNGQYVTQKQAGQVQEVSILNYIQSIIGLQI